MSRSRIIGLGSAALLCAVVLGGWYLWQKHPEPASSPDDNPAQSSSQAGQSAKSDSLSDNSSNTGMTSSQGGKSPSNGNNPETGGSEAPENTRAQVENGQIDNESNFTRSVFFTPVDWGPQNLALSQKEKQSITLKPTCKTHKRATASNTHPADWAQAFTHTDEQSRWPSSAAHVVDWNQYWKVGDKGIQVSIRWNFELPPKYSVLAYSFALSNPDGFGTSLWPEKPEMSWEEAKNFVLDWEKKTLDAGGKPGTRTMSLAEKPFNPGEVSTEEIERAEYSNGRIRAAQSGKMLCNSKPQTPEELSCSCWF
ncbi:MAG: hypothetical protein ACO3A4_09540 [Silvanigrellaceae bacterium]